jgi:hypothetical protein
MAGCPVLRLTRTKTLRISGALVLLVVLYALAGFVLAPKLLRSALLEDIPKAVGATPTVGEIHINPFLFQLEIKDFSLAAPGGERLLGFGRLFVDFELSSIWHRAYTFSNIEIDAPSVNAIVAPDGSVNLLQLRPKSPPEKPAPTNGPLPGLRIGSFKVSKGLVTYEDRSRPSEFSARLEPIDFELMSFTTGIEGGRFTFTGTSKLGERVEWRGHVSVQPIASDGDFRIVGLRARTIWQYLEDRLNFAIDSGTIDVNAHYKFSLKDAVELQATAASIAVSDLGVRPKGSDVDWISVPSLLLSGTTLDLTRREAHADSLALTGVKLATWLEPDGSFNLLQLAKAPPAAPSITAAPAASAAPAWKFELGEFALRDANISAEDRGTAPAVKVLLAPLNLKIEGASLDLSKPITVAMDARVNDAGSLSVSGAVTPQPLFADLAVRLDGIELKAVQPYIGQHTSMTLQGGRLSGDTKLRYGAKKPLLQVTGTIAVAGLHTIDNVLHEDFINWDRLEASGVDFEHDPDRLDIQQITANKLYARVTIEPDTSLNVTRVLTGPAAAPAAPAAHAAQAPAPASARMPMAIKKIVLHGGQARFADLSVQPNFAAGIQSIEGTVLGLSSKTNSRAAVDIHGAVDAFSPVSITGDVNVLSAALYTDLALSFRNMELSTFNPYSGKFAGYNITKGKLTTELHYKVEGRKLDAQHHITVDQLEFGDKTASKDAVSLPIKLAVALLKDRDGVINLDLPVSGTLDDPTFKLGPIIWKVFVNILEKAVTAPFALLGSLFGGGPDLQYIDFQPGRAELDPAGADKIRTMVKALNGRPQLKIEVPIAPLSDLDRPALIEAQYSTQLRELHYEQLDPAAKAKLLLQLYEKNFGGEPKFPESVTGLKEKSDIAAAKLNFLSQALHSRITISDADLTALGQQRAMTVQAALLTDSQVDPSRVFLVVNGKAKDQDGQVRLEMSLK